MDSHSIQKIPGRTIFPMNRKKTTDFLPRDQPLILASVLMTRALSRDVRKHQFQSLQRYLCGGAVTGFPSAVC
jgi:hypothetical protein